MVRGFQKWGLEAEISILHPKLLSEMSTGELGRDGGNMVQTTGQAKGSGKSVCRLLLDTGGDLVHCHQRRARCLHEWFSMCMNCVLTLEELATAGFLSDLDLGTVQ